MKPPGSADIRVTTGSTTNGTSLNPATNAASSLTLQSHVNWLAGAGRSPPRCNRRSRGRMNRRVPFPTRSDGSAAWRRPAIQLWTTGHHR